jgi:hypothetical protein
LIELYQGCREQFDRHHLAVNVEKLDVLAHAIRLCEDDRQPGNYVSENALKSKPNAHAGDADRGHQRRDLETKLVERHQ